MTGPGWPGCCAQIGQFCFPGVAATADGGFLIADTYNNMVRKVDAAGAITCVAGTGTAGNTGDDGPAAGAGPRPAPSCTRVGRTLAVLTFDFRHNHRFTLPEDEPLLTQYPSYARLLRRATHPDPARRFQPADEMSEQLTGVLRDVLGGAGS